MIRQSVFFDEAYYRRKYMQQCESSIDAAKHYLTIGAVNGFDPSEIFSTVQYLLENIDAVSTGVNPVVHAFAGDNPIEQHIDQLPNLGALPDNAKGHIVVIDHEFPRYDRSAGGRHTYQYVELLQSMGYQLTYLPFTESQDGSDSHYRDALLDVGVNAVSASQLGRRPAAKLWYDWLHLNKEKIAAVYIHRPHIAECYFEFCKNYLRLPVWYMCHDLHYLRLQRQSTIEGVTRENNKLKQEELYYIRAADIAFTPSLFERDLLLSELGGGNINALPLFIYPKAEVQQTSLALPLQVLFVGSASHQPNQDAVSWFASEIFPVILERHTNVEWIIVGSGMESLIDQTASNVKVYSNVSDEELASLYLSAAAVVVPLRYGAGVKGKVLEAMHYGVPIVGTDVALEGLHPSSGLLVGANDAMEFANKVSEYLLLSDDNRDAFRKKVKEYMDSFYTVDAAKSVLELVIAKTIKK